MTDLKEKTCAPCEKGTEPMNSKDIVKYENELSHGWEVIENNKIRKKFPFDNFKQSMGFAWEVALVAETENHHPDLCIHYSNVEVELSTHAIGGLSENDFIVAAKIDELV